MKARLLFVLILMLSCGLALAGKLDVNSANAEQLADAMSGVGPAKAEAIVAYRDANGPFRSVSDLALVKGISGKTIERNRDSITARSRK